MHIYLDIIWLLNFLIDLMLLILTATVLKRKVSKLRLFFGALFASIYVLILFTPMESLAVNPLIKVCYSLVIVYLAFGFQRLKHFLQAWFMFYFVNFAAGGGLLGLHFFLQADTAFVKGTFATYTSGLGSPVSWLFVVLGFPIVYFYSKQRLEAVETEKMKYEEIYPVTVKAAGMTFHLKGFVDSGNRLEDPVTKRPVMIIDMNEAGDQFPASVVRFVSKSDLTYEELPEPFEGKLTLLPYRTVGETQHFMWAVKPDNVTVYERGRSYNVKHVLIGMSNTRLSDRQDFNCLLHPKMMQKKKLTS
ncbi:sigma-E processing peptidase SpoIIGA [Evansella clarkii]|uniref:sigma-E processing peptidase SpoIIGA n=1 Tax=Evansella clarkii TaxID=79879 RepID=UPI0014767F04|nr:sigma-E processing peptidase SpoIIGA [Evansella clarkii]